MALARAGRPSAADAPQGVGCRAWRTTRGRLFSFGNERAAALVFPALAGLRGRAAAPRTDIRASARAAGVSRGTLHARIVTRMGRDAGTVARSAVRPIEPCPAGSRPLGLCQPGASICR